MPTTSADERTKSMGEHRVRHLTMSERLLRMASSQFFSSINIDALVDMTRAQVEVHGKAGDVLWERDEPANFNIRLDYGRISCTNAHGREVVVAPEFVIGIMDVFAEIPRAYSAVAETDYIIMKSPSHAFDAVIENHADMGRQIQSGLARTLLGDG